MSTFKVVWPLCVAAALASSGCVVDTSETDEFDEQPVGEVTHLEDPYLAHWSLDDFPRLKRLVWVHRTLPPAICTERPRLITEFKLTAGPRPTRRGESARYTARALHHIMTRRQAIIHDDDLLAGTTTSRRIGVMIYPETIGTTIWPELLTMQARELNPYRISDEDVRILGEEVFPFWADDNVREWARSHFDNPRELQLDERFVLYFLWKNYAVSHTIADMPGVLARGLLDIQAEARERERQTDDAERRAFYQALQLAASAVLDRVGLANLERRPFADLSGGQRQRVLLARALASGPELLLLDEPASGLDQKVELDFFDLLRELNRTTTIVLVSHDLGFVQSFVRSVICVHRTVDVHPTNLVDGTTIRELYGGEVRVVRHDHTE